MYLLVLFLLLTIILQGMSEGFKGWFVIRLVIRRRPRYDDFIMEEREKKEIIEPEVLPPASGDRDPEAAGRRGPDWQRILAALFAGLFLDIVDFATFGPAAMWVGLVAGALVGLYIVTILRIPMPRRISWMAMAALYCAMPRTEFFPLAVLAVTLQTFREMKLR